MIQYRQATISDVQDLKDIAKRVIRANYTFFLGKEATCGFIESGMSDKEIDDGLNNCTVMIGDEKTMGFAIINHDVLHLLMIDVHFQKTGYGTALLSYMEKQLFSTFSCIRLQTFRANTAAVDFHLKNGWSITAHEEMPELENTMLQFEKQQHRGAFV